MIELTKRECQVLVLAIGTAIDKERHAIESLAREMRRRDIALAITERTAHVKELDRLRGRLLSC
jgi:hypothetical protein